MTTEDQVKELSGQLLRLYKQVDDLTDLLYSTLGLTADLGARVVMLEAKQEKLH